jgi:hypothetical protein
VRGLIIGAALTLLLSACETATTAPGGGAVTSTAPSTATGTAAGPTATAGGALPLGDGKYGLTPQVGSVLLCSTTFGGRGGAQGVGPWINTSAGTWTPSQKLHVLGAVYWSQAQLTIYIQGTSRVITTNDLPERQPTGIFPIASSDPAYAYDRNPNHIGAQSFTYAVPANPTVADQPACLHGGPIAVLLDGVALYDALDAGGHDAVAHEVQDQCDGHPDMSSSYHYHDIPSCLLKTAVGSSTLVGYALDGFGIYVERDARGALLTDGDLDACHGRVSPVAWDGQPVSMYHYDSTATYPYTLGCFKGTPIASRGGPPA